MQSSGAEWTKYKAALREFDAVLEYSRAVSTSLVGTTADDRHVSYGEQIFVKLLSHCVTLRRLAPDPTRATAGELWDLASMSAVARCVIDAHDAFVYVVLGSVAPAERALRLRLWELHDKSRRLKMLAAIGSTDPLNGELRSEAERLLCEVKGDPFFSSLSPDVRRKIEHDDPPPYYLTQRERCAKFGVNFDYYNAVTMQLSQYVHTLPFAVHQLFAFQASDPESLLLMSLPLQYALPFLSRVTDEMRQLFPDKAPLPPSRTAKSMALWRFVLSQGVNSAD